MSLQKKIDLISVPMDLGANIDGSKEGPRVLKKLIKELGVFKAYSNSPDEIEIHVPEKNKASASLKYKDEITQVCGSLRDHVSRSLEDQNFPLVLGGDHSLAMGSIFGSQIYCHRKGLRLGVLWFDAHADMNTPESSETGNVHGMPLATVLGEGHKSLLELVGEASYLQGSQIFLLGIRSVDSKEQLILDQSGISYSTMAKTKEMGVKKIAHEIKTNLMDQVDCVHLSFDLDVMDPSFVPSVSTPEKNGMTLDEAKALLRPLAESQKLIAMDMVEYNPRYEKEGRGLRTVQEILQSVFRT